MRIISGKYKNKKILNFKSNDIRPTMDRAKEGLFNVLQDSIVDKTFLDLFAGTGNVGIEALSRGSSKVTFVDNNRNSIKLINENLNNIEENYEILNVDALTFSEKCDEKFDFIFIDPPYNISRELLDNIINNLVGNINQNGYLIIEQPVEYDNVNELKLIKTKKYGKTVFTFYQKDEDE